MSQIVVAKGTEAQENEGKCELAQFIAKRKSKEVEEFEEAGKDPQRTQFTRIEILYSQLVGECVARCQGQWLLMAKEVLQQNDIRQVDFA